MSFDEYRYADKKVVSAFLKSDLHSADDYGIMKTQTRIAPQICKR